MKFEKGKSGNPNGRPPGAENELTKLIKTVKETVLEAFNELQKDPKANLIAWGKTQPCQFYQIAARLIPTEIQANLTGKLEIKRPSWFDATQIEPTIHILPPETKPEAVSN